MFGRKIDQELLSWSKSERRKPLILRGARQVGKTTSVNALSFQYDQYLNLNLELKPDRDLFNQDYTIEELIKAIHFYKKVPFNAVSKTLLFIDEIQYSPQAVASLRYFYEHKPQIHVIAAGSLLETLIDSHISFPVGRVAYKFMYPVTFAEYLMAMRETQAFELWQQLPCEDFAHLTLLKLFHQYALVGGLPEAVYTFTKNQDMMAVNAVYQNLMIAFLDDVEKYASNKSMTHIIRHVIQHAPLRAGSRIKFQGFGQSQYKSREIGEALRILEKAMLIKLVYPTTSVQLPAEINHKKSPKLQFLDTGLINFSANLQSSYFSLNDLNSIYTGKIVEHIVGQELVATYPLTNGSLKFWVRDKAQSNAEVDYVVPFEHYLIPIEVKSGTSGRLKSLQQFMERVEHSYAVRFYAGKIQQDELTTPSGKTFTLLNLPYYLVGCLYEYLEKLVNGNGFN